MSESEAMQKNAVGRPKIDDVAKQAGVSRGTVSRVLNGGHWVSAAALEAVNAAIKKTGYRVNPHARNLATSRADSVAFLLTQPQDQLFEDPSIASLIRGAATALAAQGLPLVIIMASTDDEQRRALDFVMAGHVDGVLLVCSDATRSIISAITSGGIPVVSCGVPVGFERKMGYVTADDYQGAKDALQYLRASGRQRVAAIAGPQNSFGAIRRLEAYRDDQCDNLDEVRIMHSDYSKEGGAKEMQKLLNRVPGIDAVFATNDLIALGAMRALRDAGIQTPADVAVVGFDDIRASAFATPALTTVRQPTERISEEMVRLLLDVIKGRKPVSITIPAELIVRESA